MAPLRLAGATPAMVLSGLDLLAMVINTGIGAKLLNDDLDELRSEKVQVAQLEVAV